MKKFLLLFLAVMSIGLSNQLMAQCNVFNVVISNVRATQNGVNTDVTIDVNFIASTNGGNKQVFFHVWKEADYPNAQMHPAPYNCTGNQATAPAPSRTSGNGLLDILDNAFLNFGFNIPTVSAAGYSTAGILTSYADYDATVPLNYLGATIMKTNISGTQDQIFIKDLTFTVPSYTVGDFLQVRAFNWATNGTGGKPQCWGCGDPFVIGDPVISGSVVCAQPGIPNTQPKYNLFIDSKFDIASTVAVETITGSYELYVDLNSNGSIDGSDFIVKNSTSFTTSTSGAPSGFKSRFAVFNQSFDYAFIPGNPNSSKPILAKVTVTTVGYLGASSIGNLPNTCATLPVSLKNFNAVQRSGKAFLSWETAQENNNDGFEIQRRNGSGNYETIGFVDSKAPGGTGGQYSYSFDDNTALAKGVTYYRLRQLDMDGRATYSEIKAIRAGNSSITVSVYPNPSRGTTNVAIPESAGKMDVSLDDFSGKSIQRWNGINVRNLQLTNLKPGIYMLRINLRETGEQITERILVQ